MHKLSKRRALAFKILTAMAVLAVVFTIGEVLVRLTFQNTMFGYPLTDHPGVFEYRYEVKKWSGFFSDFLDPHSPLHYTYDGIETDGSTYIAIHDSDGSLERFAFEKPARTFRVVCVGDSLTEPWQVPDYRNYTHFLAEELRQMLPETRIEVIPIGVGGYNTWQEMHLFRDNLQGLEMDLLVLQMCSNDAEVMSVEPRLGNKPKAWDQWPDFDMVARGHYRPDYRRFGHSRLFWFLSRLPYYDIAGTQLHHCHMQAVNDEQHRALTWFRDVTRERGIDFLSVIFPVFYTGYSQPGVAYMRELLDDLGIEHHDLSADLERHDLTELAIPNDYFHPSPEGHALAADSLLAYLRATGRVGLRSGRQATSRNLQR